MKKPISLLLCILTLLSCFGCDMASDNDNTTTDGTVITTEEPPKVSFVYTVLSKLSENIAYIHHDLNASPYEKESRKYLTSTEERQSLTDMLGRIQFKKAEKQDYMNKHSLGLMNTKCIEIIYGRADKPKNGRCVVNVFTSGQIYVKYVDFDGKEVYYVSSDTAVTYYSFNKYLSSLLSTESKLYPIEEE